MDTMGQFRAVMEFAMKNRMRQVLIVFVALFTLSLRTPAQAQSAGYSNSSLNGAYSMLTNSFPSSQSDKPCSTLSITTFDGAGSLSIIIYQDCVGVVTRFTGNGTYAVAKDGTGSMNVTLVLVPGVSSDAIVVDSAGKTFKFVQTSCTYCGNTDVAEGTGVAMGASSFSNASLKGSYEWMLTKWKKPDVALGVMVFDGIGAVKGSFTEVSAGGTKTSTFTGTYSFSPYGDGMITITDPNGTATNLVGVLNSANPAGLDAKGLQLLVASTGVGGTATKH